MTTRRARLAGLFVLAMAASAGCTPLYEMFQDRMATRSTGSSGSGSCLPPGRNLVVARLVTDENRANAEAAADLLANALRDAGLVVGVRELLGEAQTVGLGLWAAVVTERVQRGGGLTPDEGRAMVERFDIKTVVSTELREYDQVWGKHAKFTRAGVDANAVDLTSDRVLWRVRSETEVEAMRGYAFRYAMEQAVQELADTICPHRSNFSLINSWRSWRR